MFTNILIKNITLPNFILFGKCEWENILHLQYQYGAPRTLTLQEGGAFKAPLEQNWPF